MNVLHIEWLLYYRRCPFSALELDARYKWWVMAPNTHHSLFPINHLCVLTCITTTTLLLDTFLVWFRFAWEIWLKSYDPRHASVVLWYNILCIYCKPLNAVLFGVQLRMTTKVTYLMTAYYKPNDDLLTTMYSFTRAKLASYTIRCCVSSINCTC